MVDCPCERVEDDPAGASAESARLDAHSLSPDGCKVAKNELYGLLTRTTLLNIRVRTLCLPIPVIPVYVIVPIHGLTVKLLAIWDRARVHAGS